MAIKNTFTYRVSVPNAATAWQRENSTFDTDSYGMARRIAMNYAASPVSNGYAIVTNTKRGGGVVFEATREALDRWQEHDRTA